jgi:hypothetical protein
MTVKSVSWESSRISGTGMGSGPVYEDTITLGACRFLAAPTRVSSAFQANIDSIFFN